MTASIPHDVAVPDERGQARTARENAEHGFVATTRLRESLQRVLTDLIALHLVGKQAHWNIVGSNFRDLHFNLDDVVDIARSGADRVAERMRALHASPDGRPAVVAAQSGLPEFDAGEIDTHDAIDLMVAAIETCVATMRTVHDDVDADDPTSADLLHEFIENLEQQAWFISAETRRPSRQ